MLLKTFFKIAHKIARLYWRSWAHFQLRGARYDAASLVLGPDVCSRFTFHYPERLDIGKHTVLNGNLYLNAEGGISIGSWCHVAQGLTVYSSSHNWRSSDAVPYSGANQLKPTRIGNAVWICANVTLLPGADIGDGAIISAGAVVRGLVPAGAIMAGNPAVQVGSRDMDLFNTLFSRGACC